MNVRGYTTMIIPVLLIVVFIGLAIIHIYWAFGGNLGKSAALPEIDGKPLFLPSAPLTFLVSGLLLICALFITVLANWVALPVTHKLTTGLGVLLAAVFAMRAIGNFKYVGFFKRVKGTRFARLDTLVYSPLCLLISAGVLFVILR